MAGAWLVCFKWAQECNPSGIAPLGALLWGIPMGDAREQNRAEQSRTEQNRAEQSRTQKEQGLLIAKATGLALVL